MERLCKVHDLLLDLVDHLCVTLHIVKYCALSFLRAALESMQDLAPSLHAQEQGV
jgi:hypothetical protein